ncbi:Cyclic-nucleotide-gated cation channel [Oopsacas minuta]|uniref:Cyclic-nucleotide-gated cation channel n=1 Tax=Oopsacas minuta TaxID=111878 RepID=A0AAV7K6P0_9METZ|nr:Cyclic-nucleotide-gated cation channel [Oopsacas minuta]
MASPIPETPSSNGRNSITSALSFESSKLHILGSHVGQDDSSSSEDEVKIESSTKWYSQGTNYNLKGKQKFIELTLGIHFEQPYNSKTVLSFTLDEYGQLYFWWMLIVSLSAVYNFITIPMRIAYGNVLLVSDMKVGSNNPILLEDSLAFYLMDILTDIVYVVDIVCCQSRLQFVSKADGHRIDSFKETLRRYIKTYSFWVDLLSIIVPFVDVVRYFFPDFTYPYFRILRLLKIWRVLQFGSLIERKFSFAQRFRQFKALFQILLLSNLVGSAFYSFYRIQGYETNGIFQNFEVIEGKFQTHPILFSFYWGFVMITNIHNQGRPTNSSQYLFMIITHFVAALNMAYLYAVFVSTLRIKNWQRNQFLVKSQRAKQIFRLSKIPSSDPSQEKAADYFEYGYDNRIDVLEKTILTYFPKKLGLNVYKESYYAIVTKPEIFKKMTHSFFNYLIPRMENQYFLPGEYIYQYNEVAKEMFIITKGSVTILEQLGSEKRQIFPTIIRKGESFGFKELFADVDERRRTGDAKTIGFVHCLVILRRDLDIITKTYLSETDTKQMKKNMDTVKCKFFQEKMKHARDKNWNEHDTLNVDEHIQTSLIHALKMIQVLLKLRDYMRKYVTIENSDNEDEASTGESELIGDFEDIHPAEPRRKLSVRSLKHSYTSTALASITEFPIEPAPIRAPKITLLRQKFIFESDV